MPSCGSLQQSVWLQSGSRLVSPGCYGVGKIIALCIPPLHFKVILRAVDKRWRLAHAGEGSPGHRLSLGPGCGEAAAGDASLDGLGCRQQTSSLRQHPSSWPWQAVPHQKAAVLEISKSVLQIWRQPKKHSGFLPRQNSLRALGMEEPTACHPGVHPQSPSNLAGFAGTFSLSKLNDLGVFMRADSSFGFELL